MEESKEFVSQMQASSTPMVIGRTRTQTLIFCEGSIILATSAGLLVILGLGDIGFCRVDPCGFVKAEPFRLMGAVFFADILLLELLLWDIF
jgi:hypothetical protein